MEILNTGWQDFLVSGIIKGSVSVNSLSLWPLLITLSLINLDITIHDKIVETLSSNGVASENKTINIHPPPPPDSAPFKVGVWFCLLQVPQTAAQYCIEGVEKEKLHLTFLKATKQQKGTFRAKSVSHNLLALIAVWHCPWKSGIVLATHRLF